MTGISGLESQSAPNEAAVTIEVFPKESIVKVGDTVTVMCRAGEKLQYCRVTSPAGTFNLKPNIPVSNGYIYSGKGLETGECGFTIANVQEMNNGNHTCYLGFDNTGLESNTTMSVIVAKPPTTSPELSVSLVGSRVSADFQEGQTIQAMCRVPDNRPPSNLTWFIGNEQVTDGLSPIRKEPENCGYADLCAVSQNLTHTLSWRDNGKELSCFVQHFAMDERANNQTKSQLNVLYKPRDVEISSEQFGFEIGKPGRISKQVQANPRPSFAWNVGGGEWIREGQVDSLTGRFRAGETINNGSGIWQASLEIDSVTAEDVERVYNLRASNIAGVTDYAVSISTMDAPQVLHTQDAYEAIQTAMNWLERQPEGTATQLVLHKRLRDVAAKKPCKQAIPIERLPYVGEDSANIFKLMVSCGQHNKPSSLLSQFSRLKCYLFIQVAPHLSLRAVELNTTSALANYATEAAGGGVRGKASHSSSEAQIDPEPKTEKTTAHIEVEVDGGMENPSANHTASNEYINGNQDVKKTDQNSDKDTPV
uniref:Ig-like domain-containing protein n=1 Tax=Timema douglasi TaxID=61478 RepID=A0A7R8VJT7_TIMDO|nr:unnamed protein product [Timema douglasi]